MNQNLKEPHELLYITCFSGVSYVAQLICVPLAGVRYGHSSSAYTYIHILLSPDAERPPLRLIAHSGARYEISDLRETYAAGTRNSACSSGGWSSGVWAQPASFWRRVRRALAPRSFSGNPRRSFFGGWALPKRNVFGACLTENGISPEPNLCVVN